ncbi:MAG TPA: hypothetical protein VEJ87_01310 [Acidimicrobiales bacterium]|nr:hypothetical protein [Acidimicrobiales bacterium]
MAIKSEDMQQVLDAIAECEETDLNGTSNAGIDEVTGLSPSVVDDALERLWRNRKIEGIPTFGFGRWPTLIGIRRVIPNRATLWGSDGAYREDLH